MIMEENSEYKSKMTRSEMRNFLLQPRLLRMDCDISYSDISLENYSPILDSGFCSESRSNCRVSSRYVLSSSESSSSSTFFDDASSRFLLFWFSTYVMKLCWVRSPCSSSYC